MNKILLTVLLYLVIVCNSFGQEKKISNYSVYFADGNYSGKKVIILRKFDENGGTFYVSVNPKTLETYLMSSAKVRVTQLTWLQIETLYKNSPYIKAIYAAQKQSFSLQNSGIIHGYPKAAGAVLTIDLCPSHKPLDRVIFTSLVTEFEKIEKPVPIGLSITGKFMQSHPGDLLWIKTMIDSGIIKVTWVNHTFNHRYNPKLPLKDNFLLEPHTDINYEILETEKVLLQKGFLYSVFFRFPGLVSDSRVVNKIINYGLIPVGSDAWLAKNQAVHNGSIVLIHGNGNEPLGVNDFITLLKTKKSLVMKRQWLFYDLSESVENEFQ